MRPARSKRGAAISPISRSRRRWKKFPGSAKAIAAKIKELVETGSLKFFDELRAEFPADILELFSLPGLGAKKIKALHEKLQVSSIAQLHEACVAGRVAELPGFGKTTQEKLAARSTSDRNMPARFSSGRSRQKPRQLQDDLRAHPDALHVCIAGSYRRRKEIVRDLDFIVATSSAGGDFRDVSFSIRSSNRSSRKARRSRACDCVPAFNAICGW